MLLKKSEDPYKALLEYRATPLSNGFSPAELLMGRRIRSTLPMNPTRFIPKLVDQQALKKREEKGKERQQKDYNRHHGVRVKQEFEKNDRVWVKDLRVWGTIEGKANAPRSYNVTTPRGSFRRNSFHLVPSFQKEYPEEMSPELGPAGNDHEDPGNGQQQVDPGPQQQQVQQPRRSGRQVRPRRRLIEEI